MSGEESRQAGTHSRDGQLHALAWKGKAGLPAGGVPGWTAQALPLLCLASSSLARCTSSV